MIASLVAMVGARLGSGLFPAGSLASVGDSRDGIISLLPGAIATGSTALLSVEIRLDLATIGDSMEVEDLA